MTRGLICALAVLALAQPAGAGGPTLRLGAAEDLVKQDTLVGAKAKLTLLRLAGLDTVRVTVIWAPSLTEPSERDRVALKNLDAAARLAGVRVVVSVYHFGSKTTPLDDESRGQFAAFTGSLARFFPGFRDYIIGNEPNLNRFWLPQFGPTGENVAAPAYLQLLAQVYDTLKAVSPQIRVIGGALAPRGIDRPGSGRDTHSPTKFIRDLGTAYRASGRTTPVMDEFAFHPYCDTSSQAPSKCAHPRTTAIGIADYGKLVALLGEAFDGTAQAGSTLPLVYDEFGVETIVPDAKLAAYTGTEPATIKPVDEATQGAFYREAIALAFCQPNVKTFLLFHVADEPERPGWQSGVFYADEKPKASLVAVKRATAESRRGVVAKCDGLLLTPRAKLKQNGAALVLTCDIDCAVAGKVGPSALRGRATGGVALRLPLKSLRPGTHRGRLRVTATVNPGPARVVPVTVRIR